MSQSLRPALTGVALAMLIVFAFGYFAIDIAQSQTEEPTDPASTEPTEDPSDPLPLPIPGDDEVTTDRLGGQTRFETSVSISQESFPDGADDVFLARADIFPDALSAGSLT
ncbi:MAG TPA: cell wall-binding repeat-containing protein, partial [Euzebya sp.]|nr:cell wall-binding repeat-containing protein [Euzebya sp.]